MYSPAYFVARPFPLLQHPPRQMLPARLRTLTSNEMQDYLQTLAEPGSSSHECRFKLLFSYAEVRLQAACRRTLRPLPLCRPPSAPGHRAARLRRSSQLPVSLQPLFSSGEGHLPESLSPRWRDRRGIHPQASTSEEEAAVRHFLERTLGRLLSRFVFLICKRVSQRRALARAGRGRRSFATAKRCGDL